MSVRSEASNSRDRPGRPRPLNRPRARDPEAAPPAQPTLSAHWACVASPPCKTPLPGELGPQSGSLTLSPGASLRAQTPGPAPFRGFLGRAAASVSPRRTRSQTKLPRPSQGTESERTDTSCR